MTRNSAEYPFRCVATEKDTDEPCKECVERGICAAEQDEKKWRPRGRSLLPDVRRQVRCTQRYTELVWQEFTCYDIEYHHIAEALGHLEIAHEHLLKAIKEHAVPLRVRT